MKSMYFFLLLIFLSSTHYTYSQSLSGNASAKRAKHLSKSETEVVMYGNVEAYDSKGNLVGSVLTDAEGNYTLNFKDTGMYEIRVMYAGYEDVVENINVIEDEVGDFEMERDETKKLRDYVAASVTEETISYSWGSEAPSDGDLSLGHYISDRKLATPGLGRVSSYMADFESSLGHSSDSAMIDRKGLTAGEINDFAKWDLWNDYIESELKGHQKTWNLNPQRRYMVQLMNEEKSPIMGVHVEFYDKSDEVMWSAITDNTGKAELWAELEESDKVVSHIIIEYKGKNEKIDRPTEFKDGINNLTLDVPCDPYNVVDVAFVVDATGSMGDEIDYIKKDLNTVIYNSQNLYQDVALRYASVFYRDKGEEYVVRHKDFTNVLSEALVFIDEQKAAGGGDRPESVDAGLDRAINELEWSENARAKLLFLILDAPAHTDKVTVAKMRTLAAKAAEKGIKIIPVAASGINKSGEYLLRSLALCTNGNYIFLTNHSGIGNSHIEPSTDEYEVALLTDRLTEVIKNNIYFPDCEEVIPDLAMNYPDSLVEYPFIVDNPIRDSIPRLDSLAQNDTIVRGDTIPDRIDPIDPIKWKFYPNPTRDIVNIEASENVEFVYLTDFTGKILQRIEFTDRTKAQVSLAQYPAGIYLLRHPIGKQWATGKIVLMR